MVEQSAGFSPNRPLAQSYMYQLFLHILIYEVQPTTHIGFLITCTLFWNITCLNQLHYTQLDSHLYLRMSIGLVYHILDKSYRIAGYLVQFNLNRSFLGFKILVLSLTLRYSNYPVIPTILQIYIYIYKFNLPTKHSSLSLTL